MDVFKEIQFLGQLIFLIRYRSILCVSHTTKNKVLGSNHFQFSPRRATARHTHTVGTGSLGQRKGKTGSSRVSYWYSPFLWPEKFSLPCFQPKLKHRTGSTRPALICEEQIGAHIPNVEILRNYKSS